MVVSAGLNALKVWFKFPINVLIKLFSVTVISRDVISTWYITAKLSSNRVSASSCCLLTQQTQHCRLESAASERTAVGRNAESS